MRCVLLCVAVLLCMARVGFGQGIDEGAKADVARLASIEMHGRGYDHDGHIKAAAFISGRFRALGLDSLSDGYLQRFEVSAYHFGSVPRFEVNGRPMLLGHEYIPLEMSASGSVEGARIVRAGSGLFVASRGINEFGSRDLRGAVAIIDEHVPDSVAKDTTIDPGTRSLAGRVHIAALLHAGAVIVLTDRLTAGEYAPIGDIPVAEVRRDIFPADARTVTLSITNGLVGVTTQNVVASIRGTTVPDSTIVICAHYDHLGSIGDSVYFPGANDNASGTAMMLSLAGYFKEHPPRYSIIFIAFSGEELGLFGSRYFVEHPLIELDRIRFLVNVDMTASGSQGLMAVGGVEFTPEYDLLRSVSDSLGVKDVRKRPNAGNSDHYYFVRAGVRGFYIYPFTGLQPYHHVDDRPETLEWDVFTRLREIVRRFVSDLK